MINFDTLEASRQLKEHGFTDDQSSEIIKVLRDSQRELVTKSDMKLVYIAIFISPWIPEAMKVLKLIS